MTAVECQPQASHWEQLLALRVRLRRGLRVRYARTGEAPGFLTDSEGGRSYAMAPWQCEFLEKLIRAEAISDVVRTIIRDCPETATRRSISQFMDWLGEKRFLTSLASPLEVGRMDPEIFTSPAVSRGKPPLHLRAVMHAATAAVLAWGLWTLNPKFQAFPTAAEMPGTRMEFAGQPGFEKDWISLRASFTGVLTEVLVEPGDEVEAGDLVARIEDRENLARLTELRRELGECRLRRDRRYRQGDLLGYRHELRQLAAISQQVGESQAKAYLGELRAPASGRIVGADKIGSLVNEGDEVLKVRLASPDSNDARLLVDAR